MSITFNSQGCTAAANDLLNSANKLNNILNVELTSLLEKVKKVYGGESAEQLYAALNKMKNEFPLEKKMSLLRRKNRMRNAHVNKRLLTIRNKILC